MSDSPYLSSPGTPSANYPAPIQPPPPRPRRQRTGCSCLFTLILLFLIGVGCAALFVWRFGDIYNHLPERHYSGSITAKNKIAIVRVDGALLEGTPTLSYLEKQIAQAAEDKNVRAVVLRITSPGGSITASDQLHRRLTLLRDGNPDKGTQAKPLVVSMGSIAASGGYYIAMPAKVLYAERTTITGSIGVYAMFPDIHRLLQDKLGITMRLIKKGAIKDSGSPFHEMKPEEEALWQHLVNHAYTQFEEVVSEGRPQLKGKLEEKIIDEKRTVSIEQPDGKHKEETVQFVRQRADGGVFTADEALKYGLIDKIGYLDDVVKAARDLAGLTDYEAIVYERPKSPMEQLFGTQVSPPSLQMDVQRLLQGVTPRLWYMAPQYELAGLLPTTD